MTDIEIRWSSPNNPGSPVQCIVVRARHWTLDEHTTEIVGGNAVVLRIEGVVAVRGAD